MPGSSPGVETLATMLPAQKQGGGRAGQRRERSRLRGDDPAPQRHRRQALGLDYGGEGSRLSQKALFVGLVLLPIVYLLSMVWAWRHRAAIRAKSGAGFAGRFSLWFPLLTTLVAAWVILVLVPNLFGAPLATLTVFQPDLGLALDRDRGDRRAVGRVPARRGLHR